MHQDNIRAISGNNCKAEIGLLLNCKNLSSSFWKIGWEQSWIDFADSESSSSWCTWLEHGSTPNILRSTSRWKELRECLPRPSGRHIVVQPHETNVPSMLEGWFAGHVQHMEKSNVLLERLWSLEELDHAVHRLKMHKCGDDGEPIAEMQKHVPAQIWEHLLFLYNGTPYYCRTVPR